MPIIVGGGTGYRSQEAAISRFSPLTLRPSGWFDPSDLASITKDGSNLISQINDKSGNSNNATATAGARPTHALSTGRWFMQFDGSGNYLLANGLSSVFATNDGPCSVAAVYKTNNITAAYQILGAGYASGATPARLFGTTNGSGGCAIQEHNGGTYKALQENPGSAATLNTVIWTYSGTAGLIYRNGATVKTSTAADTETCANINRVAIGAWVYSSIARYLPGIIGEVLVFNRQLTIDEARQLSSYLRFKWGTV